MSAHHAAESAPGFVPRPPRRLLLPPPAGSQSHRPKLASFTGQTTGRPLPAKEPNRLVRFVLTPCHSRWRRDIERQMIVTHDLLRPIIDRSFGHPCLLAHLIHRSPTRHDELQQLHEINLHLSQGRRPLLVSSSITSACGAYPSHRATSFRTTFISFRHTQPAGQFPENTSWRWRAKLGMVKMPNPSRFFERMQESTDECRGRRSHHYLRP